MYQPRYGILVLILWPILIDGNVVRNEDICGAHNGRRMYLELGEKGILYAKNVSFAQNAPKQDSAHVYVTNSSHDQCSLELVTCPSCVIVVTFKTLALSHYCGDGGVMVDSPCRCDYVWISEPPYEDVSGTPFCGLYSPITYRSSTRTLSIALLYSQYHKHAFSLEYTAERNRLHLKGTKMTAAGTKGLNSTSGGIVTSPFFPARYPRDLGLEYIITCPTDAPSCRIRLLFSDFQLSSVSIMEFYDWNGQRLDVSSGARFRPPIIVSSGPSLLMRFYANGGTGLGYKAFYSFVIGHLFDKTIQPITDCGGYVENLGGTITMMEMVGQGVKTYDCVWLIRPPKNFLHMKTHLYLKVVDFADMAGNTELSIRQGPTSALLPLEVLRHPASKLQPPRHREHVAPVTSGFHVSLRGTFGPTSNLAIAYAAFSYMDCFTGSDFLCQNHRCIPSPLNCDGFDHCGDNSDEPATCFQGTRPRENWDVELQDRKWHTNKANYYFPKIDRYPDLKTATVVFVASSLGLIILISALIVLLYRMGARARQQRELQSRLQTISELLDGARIDEISISDDPPDYEAPPGYDEVVKVGLEPEAVRRKKRRNQSHEPRSRNSPNRCSYDQDAPQSTSCLIVESTSTNRGGQTITMVNGGVSKAQRIPESPPPPYLTPPGTIGRNLSVPGLLSAIVSRLSESDDAKQARLADSLEADESTSNRASCGNRGNWRIRRGWLRRSSEMSRSLPTYEPPVPTHAASSSLDGELLGSYLRRSISNVSRRFDSFIGQSTISQDSSSGVGRESEPRSEEEQDVAHMERDATGIEVDEAERQRCIDEESSSRRSECSCEGACGCANGSHLLNSNDIDVNHSSEVEGESTSASKITDEDSDFSCPKSTILKLLGSSGRSRSSRLSISSGSTPCTGDTLRRSFRKMSACSRDSYVTKISTVSSCNSYEKLHDEFEIVSETTSHTGNTNPSTLTSTPSDTPKITRGRCKHSRRYSSCDLDSLANGMRILDSYLATRRTSNGPLQRKQSVTVMLFGTPDHATRRRSSRNCSVESNDDRDDAIVYESIRRYPRTWKSSEDSLSY